MLNQCRDTQPVSASLLYRVPKGLGLRSDALDGSGASRHGLVSRRALFRRPFSNTSSQEGGSCRHSSRSDQVLALTVVDVCARHLLNVKAYSSSWWPTETEESSANKPSPGDPALHHVLEASHTTAGEAWPVWHSFEP